MFLLNYFITNNVHYANIQTLHNLKFDSFTTTALALRGVRYYRRQQNSFVHIDKFTTNALMHTLSTYKSTYVEQLVDKKPVATATAYFYQNNIYEISIPAYPTDPLQSVLNLPLQKWLSQVIIVYRILILTYLNTLNLTQPKF